jgi:hypothetical protein
VDVAALLAVLLIFTRRNAHTVQSFHNELDHVWLIVKQGATVLAQATVPFGNAQRLPVLLPMAVIALLAFVRWRVTRSPELRRWLTVAGLSLVATAAGYAVFVPADAYYSPLTAGLGNRTNVVAALGLIPLVYSVAMLAGLLIFERPRLGMRAAAACAAAAGLLIGIGYVHDLRADEGRWDRAFTMEQQALGVMRGAVQHPPPNSTLYSFGWPGFATPGVSVFSASWDLNGAVKLQWHDPSLQGYPVLGPVTCGSTGLTVPTEPVANPYGRIFFVDIPSGAVAQIRSKAQCVAASQRFHPGIGVAAPS